MRITNILLTLSIITGALSACMVDSESWIPIIVFSLSVLVSAGCVTWKEQFNEK